MGMCLKERGLEQTQEQRAHMHHLELRKPFDASRTKGATAAAARIAWRGIAQEAARGNGGRHSQQLHWLVANDIRTIPHTRATIKRHEAHIAQQLFARGNRPMKRVVIITAIITVIAITG